MSYLSGIGRFRLALPPANPILTSSTPDSSLPYPEGISRAQPLLLK